MALQLLIDQGCLVISGSRTPKCRFVVANQALATDCCLATTSDLVGRSEFRHSPLRSRAFSARARWKSSQAGARRSTSEETVVTKSGERQVSVVDESAVT